MNKQILFLLLLFAGFAQFACKKDSGNNGSPTISQVRVVDSTKRDSFFVEAKPGTLIVIQGQNLGGLQAVYFNDTAANFNPVYATSDNIIVSIPASAQTKATYPDVPNVIKVVTDHGTVTYAFTLYLDPPAINSISFDNTGSMVTINGFNFQGIQKITFPIPGVADTALSYTVNKEFTQIVAAIPPGTPITDSIRVYCTYGVAAYTYPPPMSVASVSNENGAAGTMITIKGTNFVGVKEVAFPGGVSSSAITQVSVTELQVEVPQGINTADYLTLSGVLGTAKSPLQYATYIPHPVGYLSTFDDQYNSNNTGFVGWTGGYADANAAAEKYHGATGGVAVLQQSVAMPASAGPTTQGNPGLLQLNEVPWVSNINQSINGYALKFEVYVASPWTAGSLWISVGGWYGWTSYAARFAPWETASGGKYQPVGWQTVTIPLSQFITGNQFYQTTWNSTGKAASKFADYPSTALAFLIANDLPKAVPANTINIAIDNVRIVKL